MNRRVDLPHIEIEVARQSPVTSGYAFSTAHLNDALGPRLRQERHGGMSVFLSYQQLARLLDEDDLKELRTAMKYTPDSEE